MLWRDPRRAGLLMGAYFLISLAAGPALSGLKPLLLRLFRGTGVEASG